MQERWSRGLSLSAMKEWWKRDETKNDLFLMWRVMKERWNEDLSLFEVRERWKREAIEIYISLTWEMQCVAVCCSVLKISVISEAIEIYLSLTWEIERLVSCSRKDVLLSETASCLFLRCDGMWYRSIRSFEIARERETCDAREKHTKW